MRHTNLALALLTAAVLTACGGNGSKAGDQTLATKYSSQVSFGDSLSDVGTYAVGSVAQMGGGKWTINGNSTAKEPTLTGKNWTELVAAQLGLPAPCAAQTGLNGDATKGFAVPVQNHANCFNYAQGGARVTNPVGIGNKLTGSPLGALTVPVAQQIANHLAITGGKFSGTELVTVMAGPNDILMQLGQLEAAATAAGTKAGQTAFATSLTGQLAAGATNPQAAAQAIGLAIQTAAASGASQEAVVGAAVQAAAQQPGNAAVGDPKVYGPMVAKATADASAAGAKAGHDYMAANATAAVTAVGTAGAELAALVKTQIVAKGANYVVVNNMPDVTAAPSAASQPDDVKGLIKSMADAFNGQLKSALAGEPKVLLVDLYSVSKDQVTNPGPYGLSNTKVAACGTNPLGTTSLVCNASNVIAGDVSHYMFADDTGHPTPYEYSLVARYVLEQMVVKGWL